MSPKPDVSEQRRSQIIEAATTVFARSGFSKARMEDIANESGLSKGALYLYFKSKDDIFGGILDSFFQREFKIIAEISADTQAPTRQKLEKFTDIILEDMERMKFVMPIFFEFWALSFRKKGVRMIFQRYMENYLKLVVPIVERGIHSGEFRPGDAYDIALAYGALIEGSMVLWSYDPEHVDLQQLFSKNVEIFLDGISTR